MRVFDDLTGCSRLEANTRAFQELESFKKIPFPLYSICGYESGGYAAGCFGILYFPDNLNRTFVFFRYAACWIAVSSDLHNGSREWRFDTYGAVQRFSDEVMGWYGRPAKSASCPGIARLKTLQLVA